LLLSTTLSSWAHASLWSHQQAKKELEVAVVVVVGVVLQGLVVEVGAQLVAMVVETLPMVEEGPHLMIGLQEVLEIGMALLVACLLEMVEEMVFMKILIHMVEEALLQ